jgi:hypothetical protein
MVRFHGPHGAGAGEGRIVTEGDETAVKEGVDDVAEVSGSLGEKLCHRKENACSVSTLPGT